MTFRNTDLPPGPGFMPPRAVRSVPAGRSVSPAQSNDGEQSATLTILLCYPDTTSLAPLCSKLRHGEPGLSMIQCDTYKALEEASAQYPDAFVFTDLTTAERLKYHVREYANWTILGTSNEEALSAFSLHAMGFLNVPLCSDALQRCCALLLRRFSAQRKRQQYRTLASGLCRQFGLGEAALSALLRRQHRARCAPDKVGIKSSRGWCCLGAEEVRWIEAAGDYMCLHTTHEQLIVRSTMSALIRRFERAEFVHCNRSVVVNTAHVKALKWLAPGMLVAVLDDGVQLKISRRCYASYWQHHPLATSAPQPVEA
ncbi:LytR/AlgR family response regulator transcription factor [Alteromonas sp. CYL-A6]|uniref:LytR/AlgR family response regulator transcription factor n=1 Tax=Alteromonas nitratireducens TaxID=3390813 RepID=UPI0034C29AE3